MKRKVKGEDIPGVFRRSVLTDFLLYIPYITLVCSPLSASHPYSSTKLYAQKGDDFPFLKIIKSKYSSSVNPRPARTSNEELVTPPYMPS